VLCAETSEGERVLSADIVFLTAGGEGVERGGVGREGGWRVGRYVDCGEERRLYVREVRGEWGSRGDKDAERGFGSNGLFV